MSMLVGYDLSRPRRYEDLDAVIRKYGEGINMPNGPRFMNPVPPGPTPGRFLNELMDRLDTHRIPETEDHLLVLSLGQFGAERNLDEDVKSWLEDSGVTLLGAGDRRGAGRKVLAIAYTARIPEKIRGKAAYRLPSLRESALRNSARRAADRRRKRVRYAIQRLHDPASGAKEDVAFNPVNALWLIETELSPQAVRRELDQYLAWDDELLVVEVDLGGRGAGGWLGRHRIRGAVA